jgi:hypothetical protein
MKIKMSSLLAKPKRINLMGRDSVITKTQKKLFMAISKMGNCKEWDNFIL